MSTPVASSAAPQLGKASGYELLVEIASGGMATVYLARAPATEPPLPLVALKRPHRHLASDEGFLSMLLDEARLASAIDHTNVVKVRELGYDTGEPFIIMDYIEGAALSDISNELNRVERALEPRVAVRITLDALAGLEAAHNWADESGKPLGIIHRDVSPHNVLVSINGTAKLTDFGIAKAEDRVQVTRTHEVKGKLAYLAPERIDRRRLCTVQSDVFSMGVVIWECIAGRRLFRGEEALDTLQEVMSGPIPRLRQIGADVSPALDEAIAKALSRDLDKRFKTAAEFARAIESASGRTHIGSAADVARVVDGLYGARLRRRHAQVRERVGDREATRLFLFSGLTKTEPPDGDIDMIDLGELANIAPAAPSARYAFDVLAPAPTPWQARGKRWLGGVIGAGIVLVGALLFAHYRKGIPQSVSATTAVATPPQAGVQPSTNKFPLTLPFAAIEVSVDGTSQRVEPASNVVVVDVPKGSGPAHIIVATSQNGTRVTARAVEDGGSITLEGGGFEPPADTDPSAKGRTKGKTVPSIGTARNGFTKLR